MNLMKVARLYDVCELIVSVVYDGRAQRRDSIWRRKLGKMKKLFGNFASVGLF